MVTGQALLLLYTYITFDIGTVESEGLMISKAKNPDRQRALVLVVRKGAVPATLLCNALLCGVARQRTPYIYSLSNPTFGHSSLRPSPVGRVWHTRWIQCCSIPPLVPRNLRHRGFPHGMVTGQALLLLYT